MHPNDSCSCAGTPGRRTRATKDRVVEGYDPTAEYDNEIAPECVIESLASLGIRFRWALLDGNHTGEYLRAELDACVPLIEPGGHVFLDDCSESWPEIRDVFRSELDGWVAEGTDGRIGVLRRSSET